MAGYYNARDWYPDDRRPLKRAKGKETSPGFPPYMPADQLRDVMKGHRVSVRLLAKTLGRPYNTVLRWTHDPGPMDAETVETFCHLFGCSLEQLQGFTPSPYQQAEEMAAQFVSLDLEKRTTLWNTFQSLKRAQDEDNARARDAERGAMVRQALEEADKITKGAE